MAILTLPLLPFIVTSGVGTVRAASAIAKGLSKDGKGGLGGTLMQLGKAAVMNTRPVQKYRNAFQKMDSLVGAGRQSATNMRTNMNLGLDSSGRVGTDKATLNNLMENDAENPNPKSKGDQLLNPREQKELKRLQNQFNEHYEYPDPKGKK